METIKQPYILALPVKGEWSLPNTPGTRIPSHGTDQMATRYAYDFLQVDWKRRGKPCYRHSAIHYLLLGLSVTDCYCYGETIYAPADGKVVLVEDQVNERTKLNIVSDLRRAKKNSTFDPNHDHPSKFAGNYVIIKLQEHVYAAFCHLQPNSIQVTLNQSIRKGDMIGRIGHTGNSIFPHLHFQLMDSEDITVAKALPCAFETYETYVNGEWVTIHNGIPKATDRIRSVPFKK